MNDTKFTIKRQTKQQTISILYSMCISRVKRESCSVWLNAVSNVRSVSCWLGEISSVFWLRVSDSLGRSWGVQCLCSYSEYCCEIVVSAVMLICVSSYHSCWRSDPAAVFQSASLQLVCSSSSSVVFLFQVLKFERLRDGLPFIVTVLTTLMTSVKLKRLFRVCGLKIPHHWTELSPKTHRSMKVTGN